MRLFILSPSSGMLVLNLVAASLVISLVALAAARLARSADSLRHGILCVALLMMMLSPLPIVAMNSLGFGFVSVSQAPLNLTNVNEVVPGTSTDSGSVLEHGLGPVAEVKLSTGMSSSLQAPSVPADRDFESRSREPNAEDAGLRSIAGPKSLDLPGGVPALSASLFLMVWIVVSVVLLFRLVRGFLVVRRLQHSIRKSTNPRLLDAVNRIGSEWSLSAPVVESSLAPSPLTVGFLRSVIVIPDGLVALLDDEELKCVLAHEAAHVIRHDMAMGLLQQFAAVVFWWNPMLRVINRLINNLRERLCDAYVVHRRGDGLTLARSLVLVAEWSSNRWCKLPLVATLLDEEDLEHRVSILTADEPPTTVAMNRWSRMLLTAFGIVLGGMSLVPLMRYEAVASSPHSTPPEQPPRRIGVNAGNADGTATASPAQTAVNAKKADQENSVWPEGATVSGRVVDHRGMPVENAEVLLLGQERIIVEAKRQTWFCPGQNSRKPPSTRTNSNGEFKITREHGAADRVAVIAKDPLFWVISRNGLPQADNVELKLPAAGTLAVYCDLPNKPSKMPVMIELTSFNGVTWRSDSLRFHMSNYSLVNPGEKVFEHLPPGHYAVQLHSESKTGSNTMLMTDMDRQLVKITAKKQSTASFDRKVGRPLTGRVLGLENVELKYALLTIRHAGPEEVLDKDGRRGRRHVAFDVISIESDGHFTTDPIPPGEYYAGLFAVLASTPKLSTQSADFSGQSSFTVPEQGELPKVEIFAKASASRDLSKVSDLRIHAVDENGKIVSKLQAMIHTADAGYGPWVDGNEGIVFLGGPSQYRSASLDVLVRADGFASGFARFEGEQQRDKLSKGEATITLHRGTPVQLQFRLPPEMTWPKVTLPETYFDNMKDRVRTMRQSVNRRSGTVVDFNFLNLRDLGDGRFEFRLAEETPQFHAAIHAPGFLQFFEAGSFTLADVKNDRIEIGVPKPATMEVTFEPGEHARTNGAFKSATLNLMRQLEGNSYLAVATSTADTPAPKLTVADLAPGNYVVDVRTQPNDESKLLPSSEINPGAYFDRKQVDLAAGQSERIDFRSVPYQPDAFRGSRTAVLRIKTPDGNPATDCNIQVSYFDGHYGSQIVFEGPVPASGDIVLSGITDKVPSTARANRAYSVACEGKRLGSFGFQDQDTTEEFEFFLIPAEGDPAPDVKLTSLATGNEINLSSFRGKVVVLEFWATWCGPCQEPMKKLNALAAEQSPEWKDRVAIIPVSIDGNRDRVHSHVQSRGWKYLNHFWAGTNEQYDFEAAAARKFVVSGVPQAILIGPDGRIRWRGHPLEQSSGMNLESLINDALR